LTMSGAPPPPSSRKKKTAPSKKTKTVKVIGKGTKKLATRKNPSLFDGEIKEMMYGFADEKEPREDSVRMLESLAVHFISRTTQQMCAIAGSGSRRDRLAVRNLFFLIRKDRPKLERAHYILTKRTEQKTMKKTMTALSRIGDPSTAGLGGLGIGL